MRRTWLVAISLFVLFAFSTTSLVGLVTLQIGEKAQLFEVKENLTYGPNERNELDLFLPKDDEEKLRPAVVVIHGGAWRSGDKKQLRILAELFARRGYVAAAINYRLSPKHCYPAQLDDCQRAVRWLRKNSEEYRLNPKRIGAAGASAGGHLALLLGTRETRDDSDPELKGISSKVQCVLSIFGPTDFTDERYVQASRIPLLGKALIEFVGKPYDEAPDLWKEVSPLYHVSPDDAPTFIIHGDQDALVPIEQSERFAEALKKVNVEVQLRVIKGMGHGPTTPEQREEFMKAVEQAAEFFDRHLKR